MEQLEQIEKRLQQSFLHRRFDTFNQLLSERFVLLKQARQLPDNEALFQLAHDQTVRWNGLLGELLTHGRHIQKQSQTLGGYSDSPSLAGRLLNRSL